MVVVIQFSVGNTESVSVADADIAALCLKNSAQHQPMDKVRHVIRTMDLMGVAMLPKSYHVHSSRTR